jgi:hypothetical protein
MVSRRWGRSRRRGVGESARRWGWWCLGGGVGGCRLGGARSRGRLGAGVDVVVLHHGQQSRHRCHSQTCSISHRRELETLTRT